MVFNTGKTPKNTLNTVGVYYVKIKVEQSLGVLTWATLSVINGSLSSVRFLFIGRNIDSTFHLESVWVSGSMLFCIDELESNFLL
jgi:hypothetical protein